MSGAEYVWHIPLSQGPTKVATWRQSAGLWHRNQSWSTIDRSVWETKNSSDCHGNLLEIREKSVRNQNSATKTAGNLSFLGILRESVGKNPNNGSICENNYYGISSRCSTIFPWIKLWPASLGLHLCNLKPFENPPGGWKIGWNGNCSLPCFNSKAMD